jgi:hypothetical protein
MATKKAAAAPSTTQTSDILLGMMIEVGGLAIIVAVAGISDGVANIMIIFVLGVGLLWAMTHTAQLSGLINALNNAEKAVAG